MSINPKSNYNTKLSNLSKEEWAALINLKTRNDLVIKAETSVLSKGLNFVPYPRKATNSLPDKGSDEGLTLETSAFKIFHGGNSTFINSFDKTKFLF